MTTEERANALVKAAHDRGSSITQLLGNPIFVPLQNGRVDIGALVAMSPFCTFRTCRLH